VTIPLSTSSARMAHTWVIALFLALDPVPNLAAQHPVGPWAMGAVTVVLTGFGLVIAPHPLT
jgi:hypothetical protein